MYPAGNRAEIHGNSLIELFWFSAEERDSTPPENPCGKRAASKISLDERGSGKQNSPPVANPVYDYVPRFLPGVALACPDTTPQCPAATTA